MDNLPLGPMLAVIALLVLWAALFTAIEAAQQHLLALRPGTRQGDKAAARLNFPRNSLILCNTLCRGVVVILCTLLAIYAWAQNGPWLGWAISSALLLVLADYLPRALATRHPQAVLGFGNVLLGLPLKLLYPLAWLLNALSLLLLRPFARKPGVVKHSDDPLPDHDDEPQADTDEDRTPGMPGIHALDNITVNDILVPRSEVDGINLDDSIDEIIEQLRNTLRTRLPVFHSDINQVEAVLNTRQIQHLLPDARLTKDGLLSACHEPYFVPESTPLQLQLLNFHKQQRRLGMVVDEYGEVMGIVTLEDILEEIVGEFENEQSSDNPHIEAQTDGRYIIDGAASIRDLNKSLTWHLPSDGPKTLNGLVTEALETIPDCAVCLKIGRYRLEILETEDNRVSKVLIWHTSRVPVAI
ncbi:MULTISPECIES: transporter associated domain-containing protein [Pseudomonas]|uniref:transporter associated domain-containing protein n=1 Tax=Pseudomonas TaxID=286 RepID=UPI001AE592A5|nr:MULTISPECIES: transporter associated domain-containing protein [unclassified Pseudomonas]MBP1125974.1 Mg2+/Co2+ transporter CorB [Pseudomonas sp. PvP025]MDQ0399833.1 Mg2+/Co2+ transporter CorB [Pseudomonas sp. PvP006]MEB0109028.1 transporter associated domain-containing protein [Pseudomonas sp. MH9.3]WPX81614.1 transporter associated domain-containing protein [Pseudomonas sp. MH9.3]